MNDKTTLKTCIKQYIIMTDTTVTILSDIWGTYTGIEELERLNFKHFPTIPGLISLNKEINFTGELREA